MVMHKHTSNVFTYSAFKEKIVCITCIQVQVHMYMYRLKGVQCTLICSLTFKFLRQRILYPKVVHGDSQRIHDFSVNGVIF